MSLRIRWWFFCSDCRRAFQASISSILTTAPIPEDGFTRRSIQEHVGPWLGQGKLPMASDPDSWNSRNKMSNETNQSKRIATRTVFRFLALTWKWCFRRSLRCLQLWAYNSVKPDLICATPDCWHRSAFFHDCWRYCLISYALPVDSAFHYPLRSLSNFARSLRTFCCPWIRMLKSGQN